MVNSFQVKVAARGYHVYKITTWEEAKYRNKILIDLETDEKSIEVDLYCCSSKPKYWDIFREKFPNMFISS